MQTAPTQTSPTTTQVSFWRLLTIWATIGLQSFGGGASTTLLIQRQFIDKRHWMTMEDFTHFWNLCIFAPGINLVALTILIGRKLGGIAGVFGSLLGLLVPSALITCLIAAIFKGIESITAVQAVVKGIVPATAGVMLIIGLSFAQPQLQLARKEGPLHIIACLVLIIAAVIAIIIFNVSIVIILPCAGLLGLILFTYILQAKEEKL
jgi:chromate transporter